MKSSGKIVAWLCIFGTLLMGCYSHTTLTADSPQSTYEVCFQLKDGTYVLSRTYERVENGYNVLGKRVQQNPPKETDFAGILLDAQIKEVVTNEFDTGKTVGAIMLGMSIVAVFVSVHAVLKDFHVF
jgi:hypothetical protein